MIYMGDTVRVKTWEQMKEEFGLEVVQIGDYTDHVIDCEGYFTASMKHLCGKEFVITDIKTDDSFKFINTTKNFSIERLYGLEEADSQDIIITEDMVESV